MPLGQTLHRIGPAAVAALALGLAGSGCGASHAGTAASANETTPVWCPSGSYPSKITSSGEHTTRAKRSIDARVLIGMDLPRARALAAKHGCHLRLLDTSGGGPHVTIANLVKNRIDVRTANGKIVSAQVY